MNNVKKWRLLWGQQSSHWRSCISCLDNKPIEYVAMVLSGEMRAYCDIEDEYG